MNTNVISNILKTLFLKKVKKTSLLLFLLIIHTQLKSQIWNIREELFLNKPVSNEDKFYIDLNSNYSAGSNYVPNAFFNDAFSGFLTNERKNATLNRLSSNMNKIGYDLVFDLNFKIKNDKRNLNYTFGINSTEHVDAIFTKNTFQLLLNGNKSLAGQKIDLSPFSYSYFTYEKISFGIEKWLPNNNEGIAISLALLKGSRYQHATARNGNFYTSKHGDTINMSADATIYYANEDKKRIPSFNGYGAVIDFLWKYIDPNDKDQFTIQVQNLGFINWNKLDFYSINSNYEFTGIEIDNLFNTSDSVFSGYGLDSITGLLGIKKKQEKHLYFVPATISTNMFHSINKNLALSWGGNYILKSNYSLRIYVSALYKIPFQFIVKPIIAYGGYNKLDIGFGLSKLIANKFQIGIQSYYIENIISAEKTTGQGINFYLTGIF